MEEADIEKWERWFADKSRNGYAVISREEWRELLDKAQRDAYAEGRNDAMAEERDRCLRILQSVNNSDNPMTANDCADLIASGA